MSASNYCNLTNVSASEGSSTSSQTLTINSDYCTVSNSTAISTDFPALFIESGNYDTVNGSIGSSTNSVGIYAASSPYLTLSNSTGFSANSHGIDILSSPNANLTGALGVSSAGGAGIWLESGSGNSNLTQCVGTSDSGIGIQLNDYANISTSTGTRGRSKVS